jgi:uncharacterized protein
LVFATCQGTARSAPSFSCDRPSAAEKLICDSEELSAKDLALAHFFTLAKLGALGNSESNVVERQRRWLAERNKSCAVDEGCLSSAYDDRLFDLAVTDLFADHDAAIREIARQAPKLVDIYEAIYFFVTIQDEKARADKVAPLIANAYRDTAVIPEFEMAGFKSPAHPQPLYQDIPDAKSAAGSVDRFGALLWVVSTDRYGDRAVPLRIPCGALLKLPQAVMWLKPRWGGAIDGMSPQSDCGETMPRLRAFEALMGKVQNAGPTEGTIRFSLSAAGNADYSAILTNNLQYLPQFQPQGRQAAISAFEQKNAKVVDSATEELTAYYHKNFNVAAEVAEFDARNAVSAMIANFVLGGE